VLGGYSRQHTDVDGSNMNNTNFVSDITGYYDIGAGTQQGRPGHLVAPHRAGARVVAEPRQLLAARRYLFTVTYRADGNSRFAEAASGARSRRPRSRGAPRPSRG
jgi:hypothetical protein